MSLAAVSASAVVLGFFSTATTPAISGPWRVGCDALHGVENIGRPRAHNQQRQRLRLRKEVGGGRYSPVHLCCRQNAAVLGQSLRQLRQFGRGAACIALRIGFGQAWADVDSHTNQTQIRSSRFGFGLKVNPGMPEGVSCLPVLAMPAPSTWPTVRVVLPLAFGPLRGGCTYRCTYFKNVS